MVTRAASDMHGRASRDRGPFQNPGLIGRLFFYNLAMSKFSGKSLRIGLGARGIIGAVVLGLICLFQPLFTESKSQQWAKVLLILAALVYVAFAVIWDRKYLPLTNLQLLCAVILIILTTATGSIYFVAFGLFAHAMWDLWHLATSKRYVPWWYAGACIYVDLAAVALIYLKNL